MSRAPAGTAQAAAPAAAGRGSQGFWTIAEETHLEVEVKKVSCTLGQRELEQMRAAAQD